MVTLKDIADEAGVSTATVSNVINGNMSKVSPENAERIRTIIKKRQYVPNSSARALAVKSSQIIAGILLGGQGVNMLKDPYNAEFFGELVCAVQNRGYYLMIRYVNSYEEVVKSLRSWNVDGAIFLGTSDMYIKRIREEINIPLIFTDSYTKQQDISNVGINDFKGGTLAGLHFIEKGHKELGFLGYGFDKNEKNVITERYDGFRSTLKEHRIELKKEQLFFISDGDSGEDDIKKCAKKLASKAGKNGITGIFASADKLAVSLIEALADNKIKVPGDISIIGFDDLSFSGKVLPKLTTIRQDISEKARISAALLFRQIEGKESLSMNNMLDVSLIKRDSVKLIKKTQNQNQN